MLGMTLRSIIGLVLMLVGTVAFYPTIFPNTAFSIDLLTVLAAALVTIGTYLIGTDMNGRPA